MSRPQAVAGRDAPGSELTTCLARARDALGHRPALAPARAEFDRLIDATTTPMRVALVGRASAGKSTLANALLGGYRAPTGVQELTYNVNWITRGPEPSVTVHFTDGRPPERRDIGELERLTVRAPDDPEWTRYLETIEYLHVTDPAPYLDAFDLVDTPGLDSVFGTDSENTLRFLGGSVEAMVLVFSRAMAASEPALMADFQGGAIAPGPINTIAALTKVELMWSWPDVPDPMEPAREVAAQMAAVPSVGRATLRVCPVASLVGAGAAMLTEPDVEDLRALSGVRDEVLGRRLRRAHAFATRDVEDLPVPAPRRARLVEMLSGYGIMLACDVLRDGGVGRAELRAELDRRSGTAAFRQLLVDHFGNRAELISLNRIHGRVAGLSGRLGPVLEPRDAATLTGAVREFERHALVESARFRELETLRAHYDGRLDLDRAEAAELLRAAGEHGRLPHERLALPPGTPQDELVACALWRLGHWRELDALGGFAGPTRTAVSVVMRTYERLISDLEDVTRDAEVPGWSG